MAGVPYTSISANPTFGPDEPVTVNNTLVVTRGENTTDNPEPSFGNAPTTTTDPSLNVNVAPKTRSAKFGRSNNTTRSTTNPPPHTKRNHAPTPCPNDAHSRK